MKGQTNQNTQITKPKQQNTNPHITNEIKWAVGLIEAEGSIGFNINSVKDKKWIFTLKVSMEAKTGMRAINRIKKIFGVGQTSLGRDGKYTWKITDRKKIKEYVYPRLDSYTFRGVKYYEYEIFKKGMEIAEDQKLTEDQRHDLLTELKKESKKTIEVTPVISENPAHLAAKAVDVIGAISKEKLKEVYDSWWLAGYIEGDGTFKINDRLQLVFELAQMKDKMTIYGVHKRLGVTSKVRLREDGCTWISTKNPETIELLIEILTGKMWGLKSFELRIWKYAYYTDKREKKEKAAMLLKKLKESSERGRKENPENQPKKENTKK